MTTWIAVWRGMSEPEREQAALALLERARAGAPADALMAHVAEAHAFRPETVRKRPNAWIARYVARGKDPPAPVIRELLVQWHRRHRVDEAEAPSEDRLAAEIRHLYETEDPRDVVRYLDYDAQDGGVGFTTLDRVLIDAAVAAAGGVEGALSPDQVGDLVDEMQSLSAKRHRSYFHRGFFEALFGDGQPDFAGAEMNDERRGWQMCGFLAGCARRERLDDMTRAIREHVPLARRLGDGSLDASGIAVPLIFDRALAAEGLPVAVDFVAPSAVVKAGGRFARRILDVAITVLRSGKHEDAASAIDLLDHAVRMDRDEVLAEDLRREIRRRQGQIELRRGAFGNAARIFEALLSTGLPAWAAARTYADLGLARANFPSIAAVRLPADRAGREHVAKRLASAEDAFRLATSSEQRSGGRGDYCLGALLLARGTHAAARPHFERAIAQMSAEPHIHHVDGMLPRVLLYDALCALQAGAGPGPEAEAIEHSLRTALDAIPEEVRAVLKDALFALAAADGRVAARFAADAYARLGDVVIAAAEDADLLANLAQLREALLGRARLEGRSSAARFADARKVLEAARAEGDHEQARHAFDLLEELAGRTDAEASALVHVVGDAEGWEAVWEPHELRFALVPPLLRLGRTHDAGQLLVRAARDLVARGDEAACDLARDAIAQAALWSVPAPADLALALERKSEPSGPTRSPYGRCFS